MKVPSYAERDREAKQKNNYFTSDTINMPKHIPFPDISPSQEIFFEWVLTAFTMTSTILQFININRTNWWMDDSFMHHMVDFERIDMDIFCIILLVTTKRLIYLITLRFITLMNVQQLPKETLNNFKYAFTAGFFMTLSFFLFRIFQEHSLILMFIVTYPLLLHWFFFGFYIEPFLRPFCEIEGAYFNGMPFHSCSSNPTIIREEVETLKTDCNQRFKQVVLTSFVNVYYAGFAPIFHLIDQHCNILWTCQHILFTWLTCFMLCSVFLFPAKYCDVLHRASLHLGCWQKLDSPTFENERGEKIEFSTVTWHKNAIWAENVFVKYNNAVYRSLTPFTVAWPGNNTHSRFYRIFQSPDFIFLYMFCTQGCIILSQVVLIFFTPEWNFMLSISFVALTNQFTFFKIARDFLVTKRMYTAESSICDKHCE